MKSLNDSLASLCLTSIVDNFENLFDKFKVSNSSVLKRNFEFLQRVYSREIINKLDEKNSIHKKYMPFLLNRYVKHIDLTCFTNCNMDAVKKRLVEIGDTIEKLTMCPSLTEKSMSTIVSHLGNVEYLGFNFTKVTDVTLKVVGRHCPKLKELILSNCTGITDKGLKNFCYPYKNRKKTRCHLQTIYLDDSLVTDQGAQYILLKMESLEQLHYRNLSEVLHNIYKTNKTRKYNLTNVHIFGELPHTMIACSVLCPKIKTLKFVEIKYREALNICTNFNYLENVTLSSLPHAEKWNVDKFLELRGQQLLHLDLTSFSVSTSTLIQYCPKLVNLYLRDMHFIQTDEKISCVFQFLKTFTAEDFELSDGGTDKSIATILSLSPNLCNLAMRDCMLFASTEITLEILKLSALKSVDFSDSDIDITFIETLISTGSYIESVTIEDCDSIGLSDYQLLMAKLQSVNSKVCVYWSDTKGIFYEHNSDNLFDDSYDSPEDFDYLDEVYDDYDDYDDDDDYEDDDNYI